MPNQDNQEINQVKYQTIRCSSQLFGPEADQHMTEVSEILTTPEPPGTVSLNESKRSKRDRIIGAPFWKFAPFCPFSLCTRLK